MYSWPGGYYFVGVGCCFVWFKIIFRQRASTWACHCFLFSGKYISWHSSTSLLRWNVNLVNSVTTEFGYEVVTTNKQELIFGSFLCIAKKSISPLHLNTNWVTWKGYGNNINKGNLKSKLKTPDSTFIVSNYLEQGLETKNKQLSNIVDINFGIFSLFLYRLVITTIKLEGLHQSP